MEESGVRIQESGRLCPTPSLPNFGALNYSLLIINSLLCLDLNCGAMLNVKN
jgi:hypothetical protein